jgi:putative ABC transport system permease protein
MMSRNILKMSWRNIWRNKRRTFLTILAIAVGVMVIIFGKSYITGVLNSSSETIIKTQSGHIRIAHSEYLRLERIMPKEFYIDKLKQIKHQISGLEEVASIQEVIKFGVMLNRGDKTEAGLAMGLNPDVAKSEMDLGKMVVEGEYFRAGSLDLMIGKKLAETLGVGINEELLLVTTDINYSTYALPFKVVGLIESGYPNIDKHMVYIPFTKAQEMLAYDNACQEVLIYLKDGLKAQPVGERVRSIVDQVKPGHSLKIIPWPDSDFASQMVPYIEDIYDKILGLVMLIAALVILNTLLMAVMERYHEIGVMKAMGFKNREVFAMIAAEAFYIGAIGSFVGSTIGGGLAAMLEKTGIDVTKMMGNIMDKIEIPIPLYGRYIYTDLTAEILISSFIFGIVMALIAVIYPAIKSARMSPVEAFRAQLNV